VKIVKKANYDEAKYRSHVDMQSPASAVAYVSVSLYGDVLTSMITDDATSTHAT